MKWPQRAYCEFNDTKETTAGGLGKLTSERDSKRCWVKLVPSVLDKERVLFKGAISQSSHFSSLAFFSSQFPFFFFFFATFNCMRRSNKKVNVTHTKLKTERAPMQTERIGTFLQNKKKKWKKKLDK